MNAKRKGSRAEHRCIAVLEAAGYTCTRAGGSLGVFDVIGVNGVGFVCVQVKAGTSRCSPAEREQLALLAVPANCSKEIWTFKDRCKVPLIERV